MALAELVLDCKTALGESPVCTAEAVHFVDIEGCAIHTYIPSSKEHTTISTRGQKVGCVVPYTPARGDSPGADLLAGLPDSIVSANSGSRTLTSTAFPKFPAAHGGPKFRCNDGKCDPSGRLWIGTMNAAVHEDENVAEKGRLYRLSKAAKGDDDPFTLTDIIGSVRCSNGMAWEGSRMYFIDSFEQSVDVLDYCANSGEISNRRVAIHIPRDQGVPDGMTIDASGKLWVAMWKGGAVLQYDPATAQQISRVHVPARYTTSCCFGGKDLSELYITSAAIPDDGTGPDTMSEHAGGLFRIRIPGVKGVAYSQAFLG